MPRNFWMVVCNEENFGISRDLKFTKQGLKGEYRRKVQRVETEDRILYYVSGIRKFTATATVTAPYEEDETEVWKKEGSSGWPYRVGIKPEMVLEEHQYMEAGLLAHRLEYIRRWPPENWYLAFQGNLHLLPKDDFFLIESEMKKLKIGREAFFAQLTETPEPTRSRRNRKGSGPRPRQASPATA